MKAVVLEDYAIQPGDLDWSGVEALVPDITFYGRTAPEQVVPRIGDAEVVFLNKCRIDEVVLARCPNLKWVGIIATGTDNLDLEPTANPAVCVPCPSPRLRALFWVKTLYASTILPLNIW